MSYTTNIPVVFQWTGFFKLIRFYNLVLLLLSQLLVKVFIIDQGQYSLVSLQDYDLWALCFSTVCIAAAGYVINDYYDIKIDQINKPHRIVIGRTISRRMAIFLNGFLNILGLLLGFLVGQKVFIINLTAIFFLWWYSNALKRKAMIGNLIISLLTGLALLVMAIFYQKNTLMIFLFALFAFFINWIREIVKDLEDIKGDADFGCKTLPILWGIERTKVLIYVIWSSFTLILLFVFLRFDVLFVVYLYLCILPVLAWFIYLLIQSQTEVDFHYLSKLCKLIMVLGVLSMILV